MGKRIHCDLSTVPANNSKRRTPEDEQRELMQLLELMNEVAPLIAARNNELIGPLMTAVKSLGVMPKPELVEVVKSLESPALCALVNDAYSNSKEGRRAWMKLIHAACDKRDREIATLIRHSVVNENGALVTSPQAKDKPKKKRGGSVPKYDPKVDAKLRQDHQESGLSIKEFARQRGLEYTTVTRAIDRARK